MSKPFGKNDCLLKRIQYIQLLKALGTTEVNPSTLVTTRSSSRKRVQSSTNKIAPSMNNLNKLRFIPIDLTLFSDDEDGNLPLPPLTNTTTLDNLDHSIQSVIPESLMEQKYSSYEESLSALKRWCLSQGFGLSYIDSTRNKKHPNRRIYTFGCELRKRKDPKIMPTINTACKATGCMWR